MSERETAWKATAWAHCRRIGDIAPPLTKQYHGAFDFQSVADEAPEPMGSSLTAHMWAWGELRKRFSEAWSRYEGST